VQPSTADTRRLQEAAAKLEALESPADRDAVARLLHVQMGAEFNPHRSDVRHTDIWQLMEACINAGRIYTFVEATEIIRGRTDAWHAFVEVVDSVFPKKMLLAAERKHLDPLIKSALPDEIEIAVRAIGTLTSEEFPGDDGVAVLDALESAVAEGVVPPRTLWAYLETVAHQLLALANSEMHRIIGAAAPRSEATEMVRQICAEVVEATGSGPAAGSGATNTPESDITKTSDVDLIDEDTEMPTKTLVPSGTPAVMRGLAPQNSYFAGRVDILGRIHENLGPRLQATVLPQVVALHGLGGVGKTQVATEYAYRYAAAYDLVFLIRADDDVNLRRSMISLARALEVPETNDHNYMIERTLDELRTGRRFPNWLLVYDNAAEPEVVRPYLPDTRRPNGGNKHHILLTSRAASWLGEQTAFIKVDVFTEDECKEFLEKRWPGLDARQGSELAERLGRLPLALNMAAAFHHTTGTGLAAYLENYDDLVDIVTSTKSPDYPEPVAKTWRLAYERLSPAAQQLFQTCCFIGTEAIYIPMIWGGRGADLPEALKSLLQNELRFRRAVEELGSYALVQIDTSRDLLSVHSLVRAVLRDAVSEDEKNELRRSAHEILAYANPGDPDRGDRWSRHDHLSPHVVPSGVIESDSEHVLQVVIDQIRYHFVRGDIEGSIQLADRALASWATRLGPDHEMTLRARIQLGNALRLRGDYEKAMAETDEAHRLLEAKLGPTHEFTLAAANGLGAGLRYLGRFEQALAKDREVYERHLERFESGAPTTLSPVLPSGMGTIRAANNVAVDLRLLGKFTEALDIDEKLVERLTQGDSGSTNPDTLRSINSLTRDLIGLGKYGEALRVQTERLERFEQNLERHALVRLAHRNIAVLHRRIGEYPQALALSQSLETTAGKEMDHRHEVYLAIASTLVNARRASGSAAVNYADADQLLSSARELGETVVAGYSAILSPIHPLTFAVGVNLAAVYRACGDWEKARELDEANLAGLTKALGESHPYTLSCAANHLRNLVHVGSIAEAVTSARTIYERSKKVRIPDHPNTLLAGANLAWCLEQAEDYAEATRTRKPVAEKLAAILGKEHPETSSVERSRHVETDIEVPNL
jgi:tetratricopeptide (TPR) repeat protein